MGTMKGAHYVQIKILLLFHTENEPGEFFISQKPKIIIDALQANADIYTFFLDPIHFLHD